MSKDLILKVTNLTKVFGKRYILNNLNLDVKKGEIFGIIGSSGSGKSTLLNLMVGFLKPEKGDILFKKDHLLNFNSEKNFRSVYKKQLLIKQMTGFASQNPSFYMNLTVRENLHYFGSLYGLSKDEVNSNISTLLNLMDLVRAENMLAKSLSGGMQRRLDIACSLIHDPKLLLLDEPTSDLDPILRRQIWKLIKTINSRGTTVILSSHHLDEIESLCDRIGILKDGRLIYVGSPKQLKDEFKFNETVHLQTESGKYDNILKLLDKKLIISSEVHFGRLILKSNDNSKLIKKLMDITKRLNENIVELQLNKPSLDDVFVKMNTKTSSKVLRHIKTKVSNKIKQKIISESLINSSIGLKQNSFFGLKKNNKDLETLKKIKEVTHKSKDAEKSKKKSMFAFRNLLRKKRHINKGKIQN